MSVAWIAASLRNSLGRTPAKSPDQEMSLENAHVMVSYPIVDGDAGRTWTFENLEFLDGNFIKQTGGNVVARNLHNIWMSFAAVHEYSQCVARRELRTTQELYSIGEKLFLESLDDHMRDRYLQTGDVDVPTLIRLLESNKNKLKEIRNFIDDFELVNVEVN